MRAKPLKEQFRNFIAMGTAVNGEGWAESWGRAWHVCEVACSQDVSEA